MKTGPSGYFFLFDVLRRILFYSLVQTDCFAPGEFCKSKDSCKSKEEGSSLRGTVARIVMTKWLGMFQEKMLQVNVESGERSGKRKTLLIA